MPYIKRSLRLALDEKLPTVETAAQLQYIIAKVVKSYMDQGAINYQRCNDIMGALAGAQQEFYRRVVVPYENQKIQENGDIE